MKKIFNIMFACAVCQTAAAQTAPLSDAASLDNSFENARLVLADINAGKAVLPELRPQIMETQPQSIWPLPSSAQWYWHEPNENLTLAQVEAAAAEFKSGFIYVPVLKSGAALVAVHVEKKKNKPQRISVDNVPLGPQPITSTMPVSDDPYLIVKKVRIAYADALGKKG